MEDKVREHVVVKVCIIYGPGECRVTYWLAVRPSSSAQEVPRTCDAAAIVVVAREKNHNITTMAK